MVRFTLRIGRPTMNNEFWQKLFQSFRPEDQKLLVVSTVARLEVAVQNVARVEEELIMIRGRIAGTADAGRLFLFPYDQISSVYVNRPVSIDEVELFSPTVTPERKMEVSRLVAEKERQAREQAKMAEAQKAGGGDTTGVDEVFKRLEALRAESKSLELAAALEHDEEDGSKAPASLPGPRAGSRILPAVPAKMPPRLAPTTEPKQGG